MTSLPTSPTALANKSRWPVCHAPPNSLHVKLTETGTLPLLRRPTLYIISTSPTGHVQGSHCQKIPNPTPPAHPRTLIGSPSLQETQTTLPSLPQCHHHPNPSIPPSCFTAPTDPTPPPRGCLTHTVSMPITGPPIPVRPPPTPPRLSLNTSRSGRISKTSARYQAGPSPQGRSQPPHLNPHHQQATTAYTTFHINATPPPHRPVATLPTSTSQLSSQQCLSPKATRSYLPASMDLTISDEPSRHHCAHMVPLQAPLVSPLPQLAPMATPLNALLEEMKKSLDLAVQAMRLWLP